MTLTERASYKKISDEQRSLLAQHRFFIDVHLSLQREYRKAVPARRLEIAVSCNNLRDIAQDVETKFRQLQLRKALSKKFSASP